MNTAKICEQIIFSNNPGQELKKLRKQLGIKQKTLAKALHETPQATSKKELLHETLTVNTVKRYLAAIGKLNNI